MVTSKQLCLIGVEVPLKMSTSELLVAGYFRDIEQDNKLYMNVDDGLQTVVLKFYPQQIKFDLYNKQSVSFDIDSLFTNVPVKETLDIAINSLCDNVEHVRNMKKSDFRILLELLRM